MRIIITDEQSGFSVKDVLYRRGISRGLISRLKRLDGGITVNGERSTVRRVLASGDVLNLMTEDLQDEVNMQLVPVEMELDIIYEDGDMIALNKPFGMATHPSHGHFSDTLANGVSYYFASRGIPFVFRAINRLDRDTSGIVLLAKNRVAASELTCLMQSGKIRKTYIAVLNGSPDPPEGRISAFIKRTGESIITREVCDDGAIGSRSALTLYETLYSDGDASVVRAEPVTGRTHQLRVHFSSIGCPIVGDGLYGTAETNPTPYDRIMTRQALHAASLVIERDGGRLTLEAPLLPDMEALCREIKDRVSP